MDLSKRETPRNSIPSTTFNRETTMPRQATDLPERKVFASLQRPDMSASEQLSKLLGLVADTGTAIVGDIQEKHDKRDTAQAVFDFGTGHEDEAKYAKSRAYQSAWQLQGAKKLTLDVSEEVTKAVNEALSDPDHPATPEDIHALIEGIFEKHTRDAHGNPLNFGTPEATATIGNGFAEIMAKTLPEAHKVIQQQMNTKLFATTYHNMSFERETRGGVPIGTPHQELPASAPTLTTFKPVPEGWHGSEADAIFELGMTQDEAKAFIASGKDPRVVPKVPVGGNVLETLNVPFEGFGTVKLTGKLGDSREGGSSHNGEDFPVPDGTTIKAPMGGTVIAAFSNARGGNQVRVKMANGDIVGFAHLSKLDVKKGDSVATGAVLGLSGHTGHATGPHVHMTVEVKGKKVSPTSYFADASKHTGPALTGPGPELKTAADAQPAAPRPGFDLEGFMRQMPPGVDKGAAKEWVLQTLIADATEKGDPSLLNGLDTSTRADGTPSLTPDERTKVAQVRERLSENVRIVAERQKKKLQADNADLVLTAFNDDSVPDPSPEWLAEQGSKGLLDPSFAYTMINHVDEQARQAEREAKADRRQAEYDADQGYDALTYGMIAERQAGLLAGSSFKEDQARYNRGEFGPVGSKKALSRFKRVTSAARAGASVAEKSPEFAYYSGQLKMNYAPRKAASGNLLQQRSAGGGLDEAHYAGMLSFYKQKVDGGMPPEEAYRAAVVAYGPKNQDRKAARDALEQSLLAKQRG